MAYVRKNGNGYQTVLMWINFSYYFLTKWFETYFHYDVLIWGATWKCIVRFLEFWFVILLLLWETPSKFFPRILEPTMDLSIGRSIVISSLVDILLILLAPFSDCRCRSQLLTHAQSVMHFMNEFIYASLNRHGIIHQESACAMCNPCQ